MKPAHKTLQERFLRSWTTFIDNWVRRVVRRGGGSDADIDDVRQGAYEAGWRAYIEWLDLPDDARTEEAARQMVARRVKDATMNEWSRLRGVPRDDKQKGAGYHARLMRASLQSLMQLQREGASFPRKQFKTYTRALALYQTYAAGFMHGDPTQSSPERWAERTELLERIPFALQKLEQHDPRMHALVVGHYRDDRTLRDIGRELGIESRSTLSRMHLAGLDILCREIVGYASLLSARNQEPPEGDEPPDAEIA